MTKRLTKTRERELRTYVRDYRQRGVRGVWNDLAEAIDAALTEIDRRRSRGSGKIERGSFVKFPALHVSFDVTQEVAAALSALRRTGFYGNGVDCASVAEELLRRALLDPEIAAHWRTRATSLRFDPLTRDQRELLTRSTAKSRKKRRSR